MCVYTPGTNLNVQRPGAMAITVVTQWLVQLLARRNHGLAETISIA